LLFAADLWADIAAGRSTDSSAFFDDELGITAHTVGRNSVYHSATGIHYVRALIADAMGDFVTCQGAITEFIRAAEEETDMLDIFAGKAGLLLSSAQLLEACSSPGNSVDVAALKALGESLFEAIVMYVSSLDEIRSDDRLRYLGIAHGWAGLLFALLRWCRACMARVPEGIRRRLSELISCGQSVGEGWRWPIKNLQNKRSPADMAGWCNGSAGYVHLFCLAYAMLREESYLETAVRAGTDAWLNIEPQSRGYSLCCGDIGRSYALLELYKSTGDARWLERAYKLFHRAAAQLGLDNNTLAIESQSLYKGAVGLGTLAFDLQDPSLAKMPMFY